MENYRYFLYGMRTLIRRSEDLTMYPERLALPELRWVKDPELYRQFIISPFELDELDAQTAKKMESNLRSQFSEEDVEDAPVNVEDQIGLGSGRPLPGNKPGEHDNWVDEVGGLPRYVREVARELMKNGMTKSRAIATAISRIKKWAVTSKDPKVKAKAAAAIAQWEAKKVRAHADMSDEQFVELLLAEQPVSQSEPSMEEQDSFPPPPAEQPLEAPQTGSPGIVWHIPADAADMPDTVEDDGESITYGWDEPRDRSRLREFVDASNRAEQQAASPEEMLAAEKAKRDLRHAINLAQKK